MSELLAVPSKRAADIDVQKPLRNLIAATYSSSSSGSSGPGPSDIKAKLEEFQKLRQAAVRGPDRGEVAANAVGNYYDQIASLEQKIPAQEVQVPFKWKDAFDRGSIFGGRISMTVPSLAYEKACVLFNVGATSSSVAADQNLESSEGLQKALKKLQLSAGVFQFLKDNVVGMVQQDPTPDLEPDTLSVLADLMLAQAQEMVVMKAMQDKMKDQIIAKLCSQCEDMYASVMRSMQRESLRNIWESSWLPNVSGKQAIYHGLAQYHQGKVCNANKTVGEEIARLEFAKSLLSAGMERGTNTDLCHCREWLRRVEAALAEAKKDNDFIYHERVPEAKSLAPIAKAPVAKATLPLPPKLGNDSKDLFEDLCPVAVHQALASFEGRKQEIVNREVSKMKDATNMLNTLLTSMNLPAGLEDTSGKDIPQSLKDKSRAVQEAGGLDSLMKLINELPELLTRNTEILDECERLLREERDSDDQLRAQFKDRWNRLASAQLTGTFNTNAQKYRTIINNAKQADSVVKDKLEKHKESITLLGQGVTSVQSTIPSAGGQSVKGSPTVTKLKELMEDVETIKAERHVIESEILNAKIDMKPAFFESLNKQGIISEHDLSVETLGRVYGGLQKQVTENLNRQENLLKDIQQNHEKFVRECGGGSASAREEKMKQLAAAHDAFFELKGNLQEGTKFYNDLTQLLVTFQTKISDFCFARKAEKDEILKDLTSSMAHLNMGATPTPPTHHTPTPTAATEVQSPMQQPDRPPRKNDPPQRPPPPANNPYAGAPTAAVDATAPHSAAPGAMPMAYPPASSYGSAPYPPPQGFPVYTPMPAGFNPYGGYPPPAGYPQYPGYYPQQPYAPHPYPPYPQQPGVPGQQQQQQPPWPSS